MRRSYVAIGATDMTSQVIDVPRAAGQAECEPNRRSARMNRLIPSALLQLGLRSDAVLSVLAGLAALFAASALAEVTGATVAAVSAVAGFALIYGLLLGWLSARRRLATGTVWSVVLGNFAWVAASVALAFSPWLELQPAGWIVLLGQAAAVLVLAELQWLGLRRSERLGDPSLSASTATT
jgi:hypothetical protein